MAAEEDWSDSDEEVLSDTETSVQLGVPDGPIESSSDLLDAAVSRIGGHPAFLSPHDPSFDSSLCKNCGKPMELLVQLWCPLEDSPYDRVLYVWGCACGTCQAKDGSIRAWRALRFNERYAAKLEKKRARQKAKEEAKAKAAREEEERRNAAKVNPFSMKAPAGTPAFGLGSHVFSDAPSEPEPQEEELPAAGREVSSEDEEENDTDEEEKLVTALASSTLDSSEWASAPAYPSLYLSTLSEYLPKAKSAKLPSAEDIEADDNKKGKDTSWAMEGYENSLETDHVFDRFSQRAEYQGDQCIRYDLGGTPLPFAHDAVFDRLFPVPRQAAVPVTKAEFKVVPAAGKRIFDSSSIPPCRHCGGPRVFECQLMPNLINVLKKPSDSGNVPRKLTDEERRKEVQQVLKRSVGEGLMDWGTCMIFSCEKDCEASKSCWAEELVLIQWDS
ncbi:unnamed protein product [Somion occarium]